MPGAAVVLALVMMKVLKFVALWQVVQAVPAGNGTWFAGTTLVAGEPANSLPAAWHWSQAIEATWLWTIDGAVVPLTLANDQPPGSWLEDRWQLSQGTPAGIGICGLAVPVFEPVIVAGKPAQVRPEAWQVRQATPATPACTMDGGAAALVLVIRKVVKLLAEWQLAQAVVPKGTWLAGGCLSAGAAMFAKLRPAAWQVSQVVATGVWVMV
jgi:hypothetical protein